MKGKMAKGWMGVSVEWEVEGYLPPGRAIPARGPGGLEKESPVGQSPVQVYSGEASVC